MGVGERHSPVPIGPTPWPDPLRVVSAAFTLRAKPFSNKAMADGSCCGDREATEQHPCFLWVAASGGEEDIERKARVSGPHRSAAQCELEVRSGCVLAL